MFVKHLLVSLFLVLNALLFLVPMTFSVFLETLLVKWGYLCPTFYPTRFLLSTHLFQLPTLWHYICILCYNHKQVQFICKLMVNVTHNNKEHNNKEQARFCSSPCQTILEDYVLSWQFSLPQSWVIGMKISNVIVKSTLFHYTQSITYHRIFYFAL